MWRLVPIALDAIFFCTTLVSNRLSPIMMGILFLSLLFFLSYPFPPMFFLPPPPPCICGAFLLFRNNFLLSVFSSHHGPFHAALPALGSTFPLFIAPFVGTTDQVASILPFVPRLSCNFMSFYFASFFPAGCLVTLFFF